MVRKLTQDWSQVTQEDIVDTLRRHEDVMNSRLGHMLVFVALVSGFATTTSGGLAGILLSWGAVICWMLTLAIWRAQRRHNLLRVVLEDKEEQPTHPKILTNIATLELKSQPGRPWRVGPMKSLVGYWLPFIVSASISVSAICAWKEWFPFGTDANGL